MGTSPTLRLERHLLRSGVRWVAGVDEVGRGALAGPVTVGIVVVGDRTPTAPRGVRDSKQLTRPARERLAPLVRAWAVNCAVGEASAREIDDWGIVAATGAAAVRALVKLSVRPEIVILDGRHDFLTPALNELSLSSELQGLHPAVVTRVGADRACSSVAAASIVAKTDRDGLMMRLAQDHPTYGWARNVGYGSAEHQSAMRDRGLTVHHRCTFGA